MKRLKQNVDGSACGVRASVTKQQTSSSLRAGTYENAVITVGLNGVISSIKSGDRILYNAASPCCDQGSEEAPNSSLRNIALRGSECIQINGSGTVDDPYTLSLNPECLPDLKFGGQDYDFGGYKFDNGIMQSFLRPVNKLTSSDGSITFSNSGSPNSVNSIDLRSATGRKIGTYDFIVGREGLSATWTLSIVGAAGDTISIAVAAIPMSGNAQGSTASAVTQLDGSGNGAATGSLSLPSQACIISVGLTSQSGWLFIADGSPGYAFVPESSNV
jgi:hypothetical protein